MTLLIPPTTFNVEHGFSVMNLICLSLGTLLGETNVDRFMLICINDPHTFKNSNVDKIVDIFKKSHNNRRLDL